MLLTIAVATVPSRASLLSRLLWTLSAQLEPRVEVLVHGGPAPLGDKSNEMWALARGRFVARCDDDDLVSADYVSSLLLALDAGADFVGFNVLYTVDGTFVGEYPHDYERGENHPGASVRSVSPMMVLPTEVARRHPHGNVRTSDFEWAGAVMRDWKPQQPVYIDRVLYHYDCRPDHSLSPSGEVPLAQRDVGKWPYDPERFRWVGAP